MRKVIDKCKAIYASIKSKVSATLNTAFPNSTHKYLFLALVVAGIIFLAYGIACIDIGLWQNDCSIPGIIAGYWMNDRHYPFFFFLIVTAALCVAIYFYLNKVNNGNTGRGFDISDSNVYGSARDINMDELKQVADIVPKESAIGTIYGQLDKTEQRLITAKNLPNYNRNFLALAPPGYGKTFCLVLPFVAQTILRGESAVITDTKGEVWAKTVELARRNGYIVKRIDFKNPKCSDGWDILGEIKMDDIRAKTISQIIMENTGNEKDIHKSAEEALLTAVCLYTALSPIPQEEKTLYNAYAMLFMGAAKLDSTFRSIKDIPEMRVAYDYYATFVQGSENLRGNIITNLANRLSVLSSPTIRDLTSTPDIDLTLPGKRKCIFYVELNDQVNSQKFLSSLFFSFLFWDLCDYADSLPNQRLPVYTNILVEEAYAVGYLPTITNALATVRSRGMGIGLIAQGIEQFRILYGPETTETILNSCATQMCLGANAASTAELFEWLSGTATVKVKTEHHNIGEGPIAFGRGYSTGDGRQTLYSGNDVRKIQFERILIVPGRFDPIMAYTFGINRHPEFLSGHMPQISGITKVPLADKEARAFLTAMEEQRIIDFENWVEAGGDPRADDKKSERTGRPQIIPYPELEDMALAHSMQVKGEEASALIRQLQEQQPMPTEEDVDMYTLPESIQWQQIYEDQQEEDPDDDTPETDTQPNITQTNEEEDPVVKTEPVILDEKKPSIPSLEDIGRPGVQEKEKPKRKSATETLFSGSLPLRR